MQKEMCCTLKRVVKLALVEKEFLIILCTYQYSHSISNISFSISIRCEKIKREKLSFSLMCIWEEINHLFCTLARTIMTHFCR